MEAGSGRSLSQHHHQSEGSGTMFLGHFVGDLWGGAESSVLMTRLVSVSRKLSELK